MPVQPLARTREPYLAASAGWRWPRVAPEDLSVEHVESSREAHGRRKLRVTV